MSDQRKNVFIQAGQHGLSAVFRHDFMKTRIMLVTNAASMAEALDDFILDLAKDADILGKHRNIVRRSAPCQ